MSPPQASPLDTPRAKNLALLLLAMTQFVVVIDASIVNVALPSIGRGLHFAPTDLSWVVNAYTLTFGGFLLLGGRMADLLGRRRMFILGLVLFSLASFAGGVAAPRGLSLLVWASAEPGTAGWGPAGTRARLAAAVVLLAAFLVIERRSRDPLMPFSIFRLRTLRGADTVNLLIGMSLFSMFFFISLYLQNVLHYSPIKTGVSYLPLAVGVILSAGACTRRPAPIAFYTVRGAGPLLRS